MTTPRGIRNNNPGNIRWSADSWRGAVPREQAADKSFVVFEAPEWGIRALAVVLRNYSKRSGLQGVGGVGIDTVREVISRWAPSVENDTDAYVASVCRAMNVRPNTIIDLRSRAPLYPLIVAIIRHENGQQPYSPDLINKGLDLAGVPA